MTTMTTADQVERVLKPIQQFVRGWMTGPMTDRLAVDLGMRSGADLWIVGRAGVLGDDDADVATAGLAFLAPDLVRAAWESLPPGLTPRQVADAYTALCCRWGSTELSRFDPSRMARLDELGRRIVDAADGSIGTVFAGWRAQTQLDECNARVALTVHVLRELLVAYDELPADPWQQYRENIGTIGRRVRVEMSHGTVSGRALDVERDGRLLVVDDAGVKHRFDVGDIVHLR